MTDAVTPPGHDPDLAHLGRVPHRIAASVMTNGTAGLLVAVLGAIAVRLMTTRLGPSHYGQFVTSLTVVTTSMLLTDIGVTALTGREIARHPERAPTLLGENLGLRLTLSAIVIPITVVASGLLYGIDAPTITLATAICAVAIPFDAARAVSSGYFLASIRNYLMAPIGILQQLCYVGGVALAVAQGWGVAGCAAAYTFGTMVGGITTTALVRREVPFRPRFKPSTWRVILASSISLGAIQVINVAYLKADTLLLSGLGSHRQVGLYGVTYAIVMVFLAVPALLTQSLLPVLTKQIGPALDRTVEQALRLLAAVAVLVICGTELLAPAAIRLLAGPNFSAATASLRVLVLSCLASYLARVLGVAAVAHHRHQRMIWVSLFGLIGNVALNLWMIPAYGTVGAALATVCSETFMLAGIATVARKDLGLGVSWSKVLWRPILAGALVTGIGALALPLGPTAPMSTLLAAPIIVLAYLVVLLLFGGLPPELRRFLPSEARRRAEPQR